MSDPPPVSPCANLSCQRWPCVAPNRNVRHSDCICRCLLSTLSTSFSTFEFGWWQNEHEVSGCAIGVNRPNESKLSQSRPTGTAAGGTRSGSPCCHETQKRGGCWLQRGALSGVQIVSYFNHA